MKYYVLVILLLLPGYAAGQDLPKEAKDLKVFAGEGNAVERLWQKSMDTPLQPRLHYLDQQNTKRESVPPLNRARIAMEVIAGSASGLLVGFMFVIPLIEEDISWEKASKLMVSGSLLGSTLTVYGIGSIGDETGSLWATLGGSAIGGLVQFLIFREELSTLLCLASYPIQASLATLLFNKTRRWDAKVKTGALFKIEGDNWRADLLNPYPTPVFSCGKKMHWKFNLVHVVF